MGKGMKAGQVRHIDVDGEKLSEEQYKRMYRKIKTEIQKDVIAQCTMCFLAYMMDEGGYKDNPDGLVDMWLAFDRWADAIQDHLISVETVRKIIQEHTGICVHITPASSSYAKYRSQRGS